MSRSPLALLAVAGLYGAAGVATAAVAAHISGDTRLGTASTFLMLHAAVLVGLAGAARAFGIGLPLLVPAWGVALGTLLFLRRPDRARRLRREPAAVAAPTGGTILIVSWLGVTVGAVVGALRRG
ncbi:DUF423 domain-containing protein [Chenggangzhangella methanolivorans]|uniref:DUF423 domain-containing protein n=1 Tax=Chenggangzhangella methanolivorans TaxID=1437009 RepID=UPI0021BD52BB|nr:DUF423 domain-containing protein [Chenggangzhangella methanolivorans]